MGRCLVGCAPVHFGDGNVLTLAVQGILIALLQVHIGLVVAVTGDVAIFDLELCTIHPFRLVLGETMEDGADAMGIDITLLVLPTTLQHEDKTRHILSRDCLYRREASTAHTVGLVGEMYLVVKLYGTGTFSESHAIVKMVERIF